MSSAIAKSSQLFSPTQISGCQLWFDATDINGNGTSVANDSSVLNWKDKSGNNRHASSSVGTPVMSNSTLSKSGVFFNGTSYLTGSYSYTGNTLSWFVLGTIQSDSDSYGRLLSFGDSAQYDFDSTLRLNAGSREATTNELIMYRTQYVARDMFFTYSTPFILSSILDGTNNTPFLNGTAGTGASSSGNFGFNTFGLSASFGLNVQRNKGFLFEVIVFSSVLTSSQRQQIEGYLAWKWGLQANLPSTHPYKQAPVYQLPPFPLVPQVKVGTNTLVNRPSILSSAVMWIDAARDSTASGSYVNSITDRGTGGYTISAVSNNTITMVRYGLNGLPYYNLGANRLKVTSLNWRTKFVCFYVFKANNGNFLYSQQPGGIYKQYLYSGNWGLMFINETFSVNDSVLAQGTSVTGNNWCIFTIGYNNGTTVSPYNVNGTARTSQTGTSTGDTNLINDTFINGNSSTTFDTSQLAEIIHFNTNLSSTEVSQVEGYLAWKWGLQGLLPSTHAYKSYPFYQATPFPLVPAVTKSISKVFDPTKLTGCQLWLDASDRSSFTLSGTSVTQWNDKSGSGNHATQGTLGNSPTLSSSNVTFSGNQWLVTSITSAPTAESFFIVLNTSKNDTIDIFAGTSSGFREVIIYTTNIYVGKFGSAPTGLNGGLISTNTPLQFNYQFTTSLLTFSVNGSVTSGTPPFTYTGTGTSYIGSSTYSPNNFVGTINEIIYYNSSLSSSQRQNIEGYLAWKWGLQSSLPQTHPWKLFPPPPN